MISLRLEISANKAMDYVKELREKGNVQGVDFDFTYVPSLNDRFSNKPSYVILHFYNEKLYTFYKLKWQ